MATQNIGRQMPAHLDAEQSVLGAMIRDQDCVSTVLEQLRPADFYQLAHVEIYTAMSMLYSKGINLDIISIEEELRRRGSDEKIGGALYLAELSAGSFTVANIQNYINIVKEKSILRRLIKSSDEITALAYDDVEPVQTILAKAEKDIFDISQDNSRSGLTPISQIMISTYEGIEERSNNRDKLTGVQTGFTDLDNLTNGLQKSDLILIAARPAMGKSALMVNIATNAALKYGKNVAMFSLEMSKEQLAMRIVSSLSHVPLERIISGKLIDDDWDDIIQSMGAATSNKLQIDDTAGTGVLEIKAKCRKMMLEQGLDLVVIDYLQLMQGDTRNENRQQEISAISRGLKIMAKELNVPVIALSQLSRSPESRTDKRPMLSDLRESGAIEQDADIVMFLYRDDYYNPDSEKKNIGEVIVAKHRNGPTRTIELTYLAQFTKFVNHQPG